MTAAAAAAASLSKELPRSVGPANAGKPGGRVHCLTLLHCGDPRELKASDCDGDVRPEKALGGYCSGCRGRRRKHRRRLRGGEEGAAASP